MITLFGKLIVFLLIINTRGQGDLISVKYLLHNSVEITRRFSLKRGMEQILLLLILAPVSKDLSYGDRLRLLVHLLKKGVVGSNRTIERMQEIDKHKKKVVPTPPFRNIKLHKKSVRRSHFAS
ncbi:hypothetical protein EDC94DRAFT_583525 [Helicostylum pulchrum]|nr:hypothetical protein EDC94DRAFT_583525 [Helicostylum pulchrum]